MIDILNFEFQTPFFLIILSKFVIIAKKSRSKYEFTKPKRWNNFKRWYKIF